MAECVSGWVCGLAGRPKGGECSALACLLKEGGRRLNCGGSGGGGASCVCTVIVHVQPERHLSSLTTSPSTCRWRKRHLISSILGCWHAAHESCRRHCERLLPFVVVKTLSACCRMFRTWGKCVPHGGMPVRHNQPAKRPNDQPNELATDYFTN